MSSPDASIERDRALLAQLQRSGRAREQAVNALYDGYGPAFQRYFERHGVDAAQAEDLVQEVFVNIVRGADHYRGEAPPSAWLWSIARNALISHRRGSRVRWVGLPEETEEDGDGWQIPDPADPVDAQLCEEALIDCIRREFARFAAKHADRAHALGLIAFHGWKPAEVAEYLGRTGGAAREYLSQCRKLLQPFLTPCRHLLAEA